MDTWRGVIGPRGMTPGQIAFWNGVLAKAVTHEIWLKALASNSWEANYLDSDGTRKLFDSNYKEYRSILADLGLLKEK
ncbi:hypothetical protein D3C83_32580 [compost metagenome]